MEKKQLECRIIITHEPLAVFSLGMYDPLNDKYVPLGKHDLRRIDRIVGDLRTRMEREGHRVTFSEVMGPR